MYESILYYSASSSTYVSSSSGILLGYIRNYSSSRGIIITRFRFVSDKLFFFSVNRIDVTSMTKHNYIISSAFDYAGLSSITDMTIEISNGENFGAGTKIEIYEL